jgi:hypothetical protein
MKTSSTTHNLTSNKLSRYAIDDARNARSRDGQQAEIWYRQGRLEEAKARFYVHSKRLRSSGLRRNYQRSREISRKIERAMERQSLSGDSDSSGEFPGHDVASYTC